MSSALRKRVFFIPHLPCPAMRHSKHQSVLSQDKTEWTLQRFR
jgi:hypothetical protein